MTASSAKLNDKRHDVNEQPDSPKSLDDNKNPAGDPASCKG
jgi:hypothetical protein